jgi:hypothetical protein
LAIGSGRRSKIYTTQFMRIRSRPKYSQIGMTKISIEIA